MHALIDANIGCNFWFENPKEMIRNGQVKESNAGHKLSCAEQEESISVGHLGVYMAGRYTHRYVCVRQGEESMR